MSRVFGIGVRNRGVVGGEWGRVNCAKVLFFILYPLYGNGKGMHGLYVPLPFGCALLLAEGGEYGATRPYLGDAQAENVGDGGRRVILHDAFWQFPRVADALAADDEGHFHLEQRGAAVPRAFASVVGREDEHRVVKYAGFLHRLHDTPHVPVNLLQFGVVARRVVPRAVAGMVELVEAYGAQCGAFCLDVFHRRAAQPLLVVLVVGDLLHAAHRSTVDQVLYAFPLKQAAALG